MSPSQIYVGHWDCLLLPAFPVPHPTAAAAGAPPRGSRRGRAHSGAMPRTKSSGTGKRKDKGASGLQQSADPGEFSSQMIC